MMGHHAGSEALLLLEDQIPENDLLRLIDKHIRFEFVREQTERRLQRDRTALYPSRAAAAHVADQQSVWEHERAQVGETVTHASRVAMVSRVWVSISNTHRQ